MSEVNVDELLAKLSKLEAEVEEQKRKINVLSGMNQTLPKTNLLSPNFLTRAFAVYGHTLVAGLIVGIIFYCVFFGIVMAMGVSLGTLFNGLY